jgi:hypothetical protein
LLFAIARFFFKLAQALGLVDVQPAVLFSPAVKGLPGNFDSFTGFADGMPLAKGDFNFA